MFFDLRLWAFTKGVRGRIGLAIAIGLLAALVGIGRLALLGWLIARIFAGDGLIELALPMVAIALVMMLRGALEHWRTMIAHETAARVQRVLRQQLFDKVIALGPQHFGLERTGDLLLSMVEGVEQLEIWFGQYLPQVFVALLTPVLVFAAIAFLDLPVAAVLLVFALVTLFAPALWHSWDKRGSQRRQTAYGAFAAEFLDAIQGLATLKAFGQSRARGRILADHAQEVFRSTMWVLATNTLTRGITDTGLAVGAAAALALGAHRVTTDAMSLEALLIVLLMGIEVFRPQRDLRSLLHMGMVGQSAAQGILGILEAEPAISAPAQKSPRTLAPTISFEGVRFAYPGTTGTAHEDLSFSIAAGERIGFVGASGAGKSTIVKLLLRVYDPTQGVIRMGGEDLRNLPFDQIYQQVAVVNQDTYLFHGTVEDNLRFGGPGATQEQLEAAARAANAHDFIAQLPEGYKTVVGERGVRLSGGQRQRIAIARALLRDAPILLLDEALSAVDAGNEAIIQSALDRLMVGRTTLIFAHRLSSILDADRIMVLAGGRVVETGDHPTLMARQGVYHRLMAAQANEAVDQGEDPSTDVLEPARTEEVRQFVLTGDSGYLEPTDAIIKAQGMGWGEAFRELFSYVRPWRGKLVLTFVFGVTRVLALIGVGVLSALAVAAVKTAEPYSVYLWALCFVAPLAGVLHWLESWFAHDMAFRMLAEMRVALFKKLDSLAPAYLVRRRTGDLVAMATHDVEMVEYFFAHTVAPAFVAILVPSAVLATLSYFGWPLALALIPLLAVVAIAPFVLRGRIDTLGSRTREALANMNAHSVDSIQGLTEILAFQQVEARRTQFMERIDELVRTRLPFFRDLSLQTAILEVATGLGGLAIIVTGAFLVDEGQLAASALPLLTLLALAAFLPVSEIAHIGRQLADTLGATRRLYAVHNENVPVRDGPDQTTAPSGAPAIELEAARFSYFDDDRLALDGVTLQVPSGTTVALVGPSGAGKTTIAHLLLRFWDPQSGAVKLNGRPLVDYPLETLRRQIALVTQDTYLFNETLRQNLLMAKPEANEAALLEAVKNAALTDFVAGLPEGLDTRVGERGVRLSGGQRQRVAIARAFLKDAPILVLDEATSHLDAVNEQAVRGALAELSQDRTTIIIAHRLSTVRNADQIIVLENGKVAEQGHHDELLARRGLYGRLVTRQLASAASH